MKTIGVIFGGATPEHDVSIITGVLVFNSIDRQKFTPVAIYVAPDGRFYTGERLNDLSFFRNINFKKLTQINFSIGDNYFYRQRGGKKIVSLAAAINCMHGGVGENGTIAALFALLNIPFVSSPPYPSAIAMDKAYTKVAMNAIGVKTIEYALITRKAFYLDRAKAVSACRAVSPFPLIVKPADTGSSVGITVAKDEAGLSSALKYALTFSDKAIAERYVSNFTEINCAAYRLDGRVFLSRLEKPFRRHGILTFEDKYSSGAKRGSPQRELPAIIPSDVETEILAVTEKIYRAFDFASVVRMDFIVDDKMVYLNEINAVPGSFAYYLFFDKISGLTGLLTDLIGEAIKNFAVEKARRTEYSSDILSFSAFGTKGGTKNG